jgi:citrate/tricarballylate utilization protein
VAFAVTCLVLAVLSRVSTGRFVSTVEPGAPYDILPHDLMVLAVAVPGLWTVAVLAQAAIRYWRDIGGEVPGLLRLDRWPRTLVQAVQLRHMRGGGAECDNAGPEPSPARRWHHRTVVYGFLLCSVSTTAAAFQQQFLGGLPPYPYLSVPVLTGTAGGIAMLAGGTGLLLVKRHADPARTTDSMRHADHGFLWALLILAGSGMLTLLLRQTAVFSTVFVLHLSAVIVAFAIAPYTKFVHWIYRTLAIHKDNLEARDPQAGG